MGNPNRKLKNFIIILGVTGTVYGAFRFLLPLVIPFFAAWGLAVLLWPSANWMAEHLQLTLKVCKGKRIRVGIPAGIIGAAECAVVLAAVIAGLYVGSCKLYEECMELHSRIPVWIAAADRQMTGWCHQMEGSLHLKNNCLVQLMREMFQGLLEKGKHAAMPYVVTNSVAVMKVCARISIFFILTIAATGMLIQELPWWRKRIRHSVFHKELNLICEDLLLVANAYLRTQGILLVLISAVCIAGLCLIGNPYYILAGLGIGILDALPVLGSGTVLVPWALILFFKKKYARGICLIILYLACYLLREILEARLMSRKLGFSAFTELAVLFTGLEIFGLSGLFLGPVGYLLIRDLTELLVIENMEKGASS